MIRQLFVAARKRRLSGWQGSVAKDASLAGFLMATGPVVFGDMPMSLSFPNASRSYDEPGHRVRFLGHDGMFQVQLFVDADVFAGANSEAGYLAAFDAKRSGIQKVAMKAYAATRRSSYLFTSKDFS
jgi:hypothetical protein